MNVESETNPAGDGWPVRSTPRTGWSWKKTGLIIALAFGIHLGFLLIFGAKKFPMTREISKVPQFQLAAGDSELIALDDPTLFVIPHVQDFVPTVWRQITNDISPSFHWPEPSAFLLPQSEYLGAAFSEFMRTNRFAGIQLDFKPAPRLSAPIMPSLSMLPTNSTFRVTGDLANRLRSGTITVPTLPYNDVIGPSRVQVLVDTSGRVISDVLQDSSGYGEANQMALKIARSLRFAPARQLAFGEIIFHWYTTPEPVTNTTNNANAPAKAP